MKLTRRQFGLLGAVVALDCVAACGATSTARPGSASQSAQSAGTTPATAPTSGGVSSAPVTTSSATTASVTTAPVAPASAAGTASLAAGVSQALRSSVARGAAGAPAAAGQALGHFGASLLAELPADENAVLSPYSVYAVLAMARAGAKGATAAQLDAVLGSAAAQAGNVTAIDSAVASALAVGKPPAGADPRSTDVRPVTVDVANSVWVSPALPVLQAYLDQLAAGFGIGLYKIDYSADPEAARKAINSWVAEHTADLIPALLGEGVITHDTVMTLVNAMHLTAPWQDPLRLTNTGLPFATASSGSVQAKCMSRNGMLGTATGTGWTSVTIPYRGGGLAMTVVLPDAGSFAAVRAGLDTVLRSAATSSVQQGVRLTMPTFRSQTHLSLKKAMQTLGVADLFDRTADLSGIAGPPHYLRADELVHQSVISVDEKGTEAAAATAMVAVAATAIGGGSLEFIVDRPFLYSVHDTVTGAPLFLGQVTDPTK